MSKVLQNAPREHSAILSTCIKLPSVFKTFVLSFFEWPLKTGFTVLISQGHYSCLFDTTQHSYNSRPGVMFMYINTCEQGYQSTYFIGKYKEYILARNNIGFEIFMSRTSYYEQAKATIGILSYSRESLSFYETSRKASMISAWKKIHVMK